MELAAVDLGASSGRVLVARLHGSGRGMRLTLEEAHRFEHGPVPVPHEGGMTYRWAVLKLWSELLQGLRRAAALAPGIAGVGVDTWGVDFALLDSRGHLIGLPMSYRDARFAPEMPAVCAAVGREELFRRTGLQFMPFNTLFQLAAMRRHEPAALERAAHLLLMPDLFLYWLGDMAPAAEFTIASTSQMVETETRNWDRELLGRLGLPDRILPPILEPGTLRGPLRRIVSSETGLPASVQVRCTAGHDTAAAVAATPGEGRDWAFLSSGTWCLFGAEIRLPRLSSDVLEAGFGNEGGVGGTYRLLRNITGLWLVQECRRYWRERGEDYSWAELAAAAAEAPPFAAVIDPDDPAFAQPCPMPEIIAARCLETGQRQPQSPGECIRICLEAIALTVRRRWRDLERILGRELRVLNMVGGGIRNELLCRTIAGVIEKPVLAGPVEATAAGNALVQLIGMGEVEPVEARRLVRRSWPLTEYLPEPQPGLEEAVALFEKLYG